MEDLNGCCITCHSDGIFHNGDDI